MSCPKCKNWKRTAYFDYCKILSCKPSPTGNPKTCPYFIKD